jgi:hypothetical protein
MAEVVDLRGRQQVPAPAPVLADPSGRRARLLRRSGRAVAIVFLAWLIGLVLAGLGILPTSALPLSQFAGVSPPALSGPIHIAAVPRSDLAPATPLRSATAAGVRTAAAARRSSNGSAAGSLRAGSGTVSPRVGATHKAGPPTGTTNGKPGIATHPGSGAVTGGAGTTTTIAATGSPTVVPVSRGNGTTHGKSGVAPGKVKQTTTTTPSATTTTSTATTATPGNSGTAPGHSVTTPGHGHRG